MALLSLCCCDKKCCPRGRREPEVHTCIRDIRPLRGVHIAGIPVHRPESLVCEFTSTCGGGPGSHFRV